MENHPIPQDITGFQFKLIGNMTLKQFAYLAAGVAIAWVIYLLPVIIFIKIPLAAIFAIFGICLAFVPIQGRPMDLMIKNFFKAVFNPTQYVYQKGGGNLLQNNATIDSAIGKNQKPGTVAKTREKQLADAIKSLPKEKIEQDKKETVFFQPLGNNAQQPVGDITQPAFVGPHAFANKAPMEIPQAPIEKTDEPEAKNKVDENLKQTALLLQKELQEAKAKESADSVNTKEYLEAHQKVLDLQNNLNDLLSQKQDL